MASKVKISNVLLCEHLVPGLGNKQTLINVYSGDIVVAELPAKLFLAIYAEYSSNSDDAFTVLVEIMINKKPFARLRFDVDAGRQQGVMAIPNMELGFDREVTLEVRAAAEGERARTILSKKVFRGDVPMNVPAPS